MAAGTPLTGNGMTIYSGGTPTEVDHGSEWSIDISAANAMFATNSTGGWKQSVTGVKEWSGSMTLLAHAGGAPAFTIGQEVACQFHGVESSQYYSGTVQITKVSTVFAADSADPIALKYEFNGSGALTVTGTYLDVIP